MILFDWGTYNALTKLPVAATLGMKLTEIPPYDFSRKSRTEEYFSEYRKFAKDAFTTVVAHAPYYNVVSIDRGTMEKSWKALLTAALRAKEAGAEIFNLHLGWRAYGDHRDLEYAEEFLRRLVDTVSPDMIVSVEVTYTRRMLGTWDEIKALRESIGEDKLIVSVQLENAWMLETGASDTGDFMGANNIADENFWNKILEKIEQEERSRRLLAR